ncbi:arsenate reductase (glutaredoxin) [Polaribacter sp. MSW5]|uniref:Arsenate reductase (Glutaredoxin) n=2 Tax=Polaribacter ponticola TaxID=2978475 RepID=A0ABT5S8N3_9FLAO|nr:arsenate reductase (glutaredoxin) [Polaribacter sp. MSW5]MDD7914453.1 arsenate reductase (glutaredoxin) [Polaribacter sp. MSW5]
MMKIYHNKMCSKSRCSYDLLKDKGVEFETIEYLKKPLTKAELTELLSKLNIPAEDLIRTSESDYIQNFKGKNLSELEWINAMIKYPKLIERPIVVKGNKAVIGRPIEKVIELLSE